MIIHPVKLTISTMTVSELLNVLKARKIKIGTKQTTEQPSILGYFCSLGYKEVYNDLKYREESSIKSKVCLSGKKVKKKRNGEQGGPARSTGMIDYYVKH